jgi:glyoxylase-like metal-dependent hydrolase (beta-lactamase superfamily II)
MTSAPGTTRGTLTGASARFEKGLRELGPGVWAWLQPNGAWGEANAGLIAGQGEGLLVDTLWDERLAREMLDAMEPVLAGRRLATVVNTHSDGDHWWGNAAAPAAAEIVTSAPSRKAMDNEASPAELARMGGLSGRARWVPGPLGGLSRYVSEMLGPFEFGGVRLRFPDRTFSGSETLDVGGREVRLIEVGPAHTPGDAIVHVPDAGVVFAADVLFVDATPVMWFGPLEGWLRAVETLLSLDAETYVPGHGPPGGRDAVLEMRDYLIWLDTGVREHHAAGRSPLEAARVMTGTGEFVRWRAWECPERVLITITTIHRTLEGEGPVGVSPLARARLFAQIATLREELAM